MKRKFDKIFEDIMSNTDIKDFETLKTLFLNLAERTKFLCEDNSWDSIEKAQNAIQAGLDFLGLPYSSIDTASPDYVNANMITEKKNKK